MRVALIHALRHSVAPVEDAFLRLWPEARRVNLLDDSLSADLAAAGALAPAITDAHHRARALRGRCRRARPAVHLLRLRSGDRRRRGRPRTAAGAAAERGDDRGRAGGGRHRRADRPARDLSAHARQHAGRVRRRRQRRPCTRRGRAGGARRRRRRGARPARGRGRRARARRLRRDRPRAVQPRPRRPGGRRLDRTEGAHHP